MNLSKKRIIGLVGLAGSGKGTVGNILKEYGYQPVSFASKLKDLVAILFNWPRMLLEGDTEPSRVWRETVDEWWSEKLEIKNFTPRMALQLIGTDALRNHFHMNIWSLVVRNILESDPNQKFVITDCRFENEILMIGELDGEVWEVTRGTKPRWYHEVEEYHNLGIKITEGIMSEELRKVHPSEWSWIAMGIDTEIMNDGTIADLAIKVEKLLGV